MNQSELNPALIKRRGNYISIAPGLTATEGRDCGLKTLVIKKNGKLIKKYRGSSLSFGSFLSSEDKRYLISLCG